jgi:hypothetical protein
MLEGHCFCGFVRYEADGPGFNRTNCHCSTCRRISAAPSVAWVSVSKAGFRIVSGELKSFRSSDRATRSFCPRCGTPLTYTADALPDELDITIGSLAKPETMPPADHTWVSDKLSWLTLCDDLPAYPESRTVSERSEPLA